MVDPKSFRRGDGYSHLAITRGDERLVACHVGPHKKMCLVHAYCKIVKVAAEGEIYDACEWCLTNAPTIEVDFVETTEEPLEASRTDQRS